MAVKLTASGRVVNINPPTRLSKKQRDSISLIPVDEARIRAIEETFKNVKVSKMALDVVKKKNGG
ncbi:hypothetical protein [Thioflexithrix psekupsensis]|uniref:Uncharacterized protein n=1 Tax=Thioflexithrix psekupsensis TaxID=1570016 RepID=A0A251XC49_9GAMM|nr:hypothetical protein [Thioflexithrix psekupsensis]OUD16307.1 hypothetical protein TPSD3_00880 [Thioflexithrix psekupsensis]